MKIPDITNPHQLILISFTTPKMKRHFISSLSPKYYVPSLVLDREVGLLSV